MLVRIHMVREVLSASEDDSSLSPLEAMRINAIRHIPVVSGAKLVGIVMDRDFLRILPGAAGAINEAERQGAPIPKVSMAMIRNPITVGPNDLIEDVAQIFEGEKISSLPVVDQGTLVGIVTCADVLRVLAELFSGTEGRRLTLMYSPECETAVAFNPILECAKRGVRVLSLATHGVRRGSRVNVLWVEGREERIAKFTKMRLGRGLPAARRRESPRSGLGIADLL